MACKTCGYRGYIFEDKFYKDEEVKEASPCPKCNDVKAFSEYCRKIYGNKPYKNAKKRMKELGCEDGDVINLNEVKR